MTDHEADRPPAADPRVGLAAERTLLAWVRTGLALMGFGFVVARFGLFLREIAAVRIGPPESSGMATGLSAWIGGGLVVLGVMVNVAAAFRHVRLMRRLERGEPYSASPWSLGVGLTLLLAGIGVLMTVYLILGSH
jgi:putative membrane protein